jgi:hypothetical protein
MHEEESQLIPTTPSHSGGPGTGFLERHRVVAAISAVVVTALIGALIGAAIALALTKAVATAADLTSAAAQFYPPSLAELAYSPPKDTPPTNRWALLALD